MQEREPSILTGDGAGANKVSARPVPEARPGERRPREASAEGPVVVVAGFWRRLAAALVDLAAIVPVAWLITWIAGNLAGMHLPEARHTGVDYWLDLALAGEPALWGGVVLFVAVAVIYLLLFQTLAARTPGMRLLGLRVIDLHGDAPSVLRVCARTAGYVVSVATFSLGFLWIGFDREKRGLHDWLAGTYVIKGTVGGTK
jgi:uncharacterized RDD family membrane protein YckC